MILFSRVHSLTSINQSCNCINSGKINTTRFQRSWSGNRNLVPSCSACKCKSFTDVVSHTSSRYISTLALYNIDRSIMKATDTESHI